jgi:hypothetical protein
MKPTKKQEFTIPSREKCTCGASKLFTLYALDYKDKSNIGFIGVEVTCTNPNCKVDEIAVLEIDSLNFA